MKTNKAIESLLKLRNPEEITYKETTELSMDNMALLLQSLIPVALMAVNNWIQDEVQQIVGSRYKHKNDFNGGLSRYGSQTGSIYLGKEKVKINKQRVRDTSSNKEIELETYKNLQYPRELKQNMLSGIIGGLSMGNYGDAVKHISDSYGLSRSNVSRHFIEASKEGLNELMNRNLSDKDILALIIDGKSFSKEQMIIALGITIEGEKLALGFVQSTTENHKSVKGLLRNLINRGLDINKGLLCVIDGSKGLRKAIEETFGKYGIIQRCQFHKRENVISYLPDDLQSEYKRKIQHAYSEPTYDESKRKLLEIMEELKPINLSAVRSLEEGLEETLTLHRLGIYSKLGRSFSTTNVLESINSSVERKTRHITYWKNSSQKQRWLAVALLDTEQRLNKVSGYKHLKLLREALMNEVKRKTRFINSSADEKKFEQNKKLKNAS